MSDFVQIKNTEMVVILNLLAKYFEDVTVARVLKSIEDGEVFEQKTSEWEWVGDGEKPLGLQLVWGNQNWEKVEKVVVTPMAEVIMQEFLDLIATQADQLVALHIEDD